MAVDATVLEAVIGLAGVIIGGLLGYWLGRRGYLYEQRFKERQKRRDALRKLLGTIKLDLSFIMNEKAAETERLFLLRGIFSLKTYKSAKDLIKETESLAALFVNTPLIHDQLQELNSLLLSLSLASLQSDDDFDLDVFKEEAATVVGELIDSYRTLDASVTGEGKKRRLALWR